MKILKKFLLAVVVLIVLALIIALFVKKEMAAEREITINKPEQEVFGYVKYLKNQNNYSKWATMDPNMKKEFRGTDATAGFVSAWESNNKDVGKGEQEITAIKEGRIEYEIRFIEPFPSTAYAYMTTKPISATQTKVQWGFSGKMAYPMNIMRLFMDMDDMIGDDFEAGLNSLKRILEKP